jgi:hypothetical protein
MTINLDPDEFPPCEPTEDAALNDAGVAVFTEAVILAVLEVMRQRVTGQMDDMLRPRSFLHNEGGIAQANEALRTAIKDCAELLP